MFLCLFCVSAHGSVSVCVCHVLLLSHLLVSPGHAPLSCPHLLDGVHLILVCSAALYCVPFSCVFAGSFWCLPVSWSWIYPCSCASYFDLAQVILWISYLVILYPRFLFLFSLVLVLISVHYNLVLFSLFDLDFHLPLFLLFQFPFWILAFCFYFLIIYFG